MHVFSARVVQMGALYLEENKLLLQHKISTPNIFPVGTQGVTASPAAQIQPNPECSLSHFGYIQQFKVHLFQLFITFIHHFVHNFHTSLLTSTDCCMSLVYHWLNKTVDLFLSAVCLGCGSFRSSFLYGFSRSGSHPVWN